MTATRLLCIVIMFICSQANLHAQPEKAWKKIFDGSSFSGWNIIDTPANVVVTDSAFLIHMTLNTSRHAFIRTKEEYSDFILELEMKRDIGFDSGILLRGIPTPDTTDVGLYGYTVKIDPSTTRRWTGGIFLDFGYGVEWLSTLADNPKAQQAERIGEWNHFRIEAIGHHIKVWINGVPATNMIDNRYKKGCIAFKIHSMNGSKWTEDMAASFRNFRIISQDAAAYERAMDISVKVIP